jgi:nitrate reductase NapE component
MKVRINLPTCAAVTIFVLMASGCQFLKNSFDYGDTVKDFTQYMLEEKYDECLGLIVINKGANIDTLRSQLPRFRVTIINNFGKDLEYTFMRSVKNFSTVESEKTGENSTEVRVQFENKTHFGVLVAVFDDETKKIIKINTLGVKEPIPSMTIFWLAGLVAIMVPMFNVYVIRKIAKSNLKRKWAKYLAVILLNVPALSYAAVAGFGFQVLNFQFLLGISFGYMGYGGSYWTIGLPMGGLFWFLNLRNKEKQDKILEMSLSKMAASTEGMKG